MILFKKDCVLAMKQMMNDCVDSIVTDPPYELGFMGKSWDGSGIAYSVEMWSEALRILKPGGHLLAFGGTRTYHRMACAIEDAGFEIRDSINWIYGSGFPKSHNVSKGIDKAAGADRNEIIGWTNKGMPSGANKAVGHGAGSEPTPITAASTPAAKQWDGWGTALKPAHEPIVVARKPLIGTVAANVLEYGTGALNIDGSRVGTGTGETKAVNYPDIRGNNYNNASGSVEYTVTDQGRWPANVIFDEDAGVELDAQSGVSKDGGASRFFYCPKASKAERNAGLEGLPLVKGGSMNGAETRPNKPTNHPIRQNFHPTVKPLALMRYLVRLVTPPGGVVFDPFLGSGTTAVATILEGKIATGAELTEDYYPIIEARVAWAQKQPLETKEPTLFDVT